MTKILQCNIQSIEKHKDELIRVLIKENYKIAIISESWTKEDHEATKYKIPYFQNYYSSREDGYGGSMILAHESLISKNLNMYYTANIQCVGRCFSSLDLVIVSIYVSPTTTRAEFKSCITEVFRTIRPYKRYIIGGDFNSHHFAWDEYHEDGRGIALYDIINEENAILMNNRNPTYIPAELDKKPSTIDLVICSVSQVRDTEMIILDYGIGSRHLALNITIQKETITKQKWFVNKRKVLQSLKEVNAEEIKNINDLQKRAKRIVKEAKQRCKYEPKYWWTEEIEAAWKVKNKAREKFNKISNLENLLQLKKTECIFHRVKKEAKTQKFREFAEEIDPKTSNKELWRKINNLTGKRKKTKRTVVHQEIDKAVEFLDLHFPVGDLYPQLQNGMTNYDIITAESWNNILNKKKKATAPGTDEISYEMLRNLNPQVTEIVRKNLNDMWRKGKIDNSLKKIKVIAIPKPGRNPEIVANLRPIAMINCALKVLNAAVLQEFERFLTRKVILPDKSFGFRKHRSTVMCANFVVNKITEIKRDKKVAATIFVDLTNAYNSVNTRKLDELLQEFGTPQEFINYIAAFLTDRRVQIKVGTEVVERTINDGLPQGDVMSPTLFNVYTTPLHEIEENGVELVQFADDFAAIVEGETFEIVQSRAQRFLQKFAEKATELNLYINVTKTKTMLFQKNSKLLNLSLHNEIVETVNVHNYLGITFDRGLRFGSYTRQIKSNIIERINMIKILAGNKYGGHPQTMGLVYNGIIRGYLDYGSSIYDNASKSNLEAITVANNACLRKITGCSKTTPVNTLYAIASQHPLHFRRELSTYKELIRHAQYNSPVYQQLEKQNETVSDSPIQTKLEKAYWMNKNILNNLSQTITTPLNASIITVDTELGNNWNKANTSTRVLKQLTLYLLNGKYKNYTHIYTDASKVDETCGIGIYDDKNNVRISLRLEYPVCSMSAEIEAIFVALQYIEKNQIKDAVILTDSKSGCEFIRTQCNSRERNEVIHEIITRAARTNTRIQWIPGHTDILGNDLADRLAKNGLQQPEMVTNSIFPHDAVNLFENLVTTKTQNWYVSYTQELGKGRKFFNYQTCINKKSWFHNLPLTNTEVRTLNRLISGHDYSPYWLSIMKIDENPNCTTCGTLNTSEHIILHCSKTQERRTQLGLQKYKTIREVFESKHIDNLKNILTLLREINMQA